MTPTARVLHQLFPISTHTPHTRHDLSGRSATVRFFGFLLTRLIRGMTQGMDEWRTFGGFLLTRLIRGMTMRTQPFQSYVKFLLTRLIRGMTAKYTNISQSHHSI